MGLRLVDVAPVISPCHGEGCLDQGSVDGDEVAQMFILERERAAGDPAQFAEHIRHLIQPAGVDGLIEGTLLDTFRGRAGNDPGNLVFFEELQQFLTGTVLFEMKQYQRGELLVVWDDAEYRRFHKKTGCNAGFFVLYRAFPNQEGG